MAKSSFLGLELTESQLTLFADWRKSVNGNNDGEIVELSNDQIIDIFAEDISKTISEYENLAAFPAMGSVKRFYIALDTGYCYRWDANSEEYILLAGGGGEIQQATEEILGGIHAAEKTESETAEIKIDTVTGKLYGPAVDGGEIQQATEEILGGIYAAEKTESETAEIKIDTATGKLYGPAGGGGDPTYKSYNNITDFDINVNSNNDCSLITTQLDQPLISVFETLVSGLECSGGEIVSNTSFSNLAISYKYDLGEPEGEQIINSSIIDNYILQGDWKIYFPVEEDLGSGKYIIILLSNLYNVYVAIVLDTLDASWYVTGFSQQGLGYTISYPCIIMEIHADAAPVYDIALSSTNFVFDISTKEKVEQFDDSLLWLLNDIVKVSFVSPIGEDEDVNFTFPVPPKYAFKGNFISEPAQPCYIDPWKAFDYWSLDEFAGDPFDFTSTPITENMTLYSQWHFNE